MEVFHQSLCCLSLVGFGASGVALQRYSWSFKHELGMGEGKWHGSFAL